MPSVRIQEFDTWRPGYGLASVRVLQAGTSVLATIYTDEALSTPATNPQTLAERLGDDGISYGRFAMPLYVGVSYQLDINSVDETGVQRVPLTTLDGQDASDATAIVTGGSEEVALADHLARRIDVRDYGEFKAVGEVGASSSTNAATMTAAIGVAGGRGGGIVRVPAGTYQFTTFNLSAGVVVEGESRDGTILQSTTAGNAASIAGDRAGFARLTIDGVKQVALSVGIYAADIEGVILDDVTIKRFETGLQLNGGTLCDWRELVISDCVTGYKGKGLLDASTDAKLLLNHWHGGKVELCSTVGIYLTTDGRETIHNTFSDISFDTNTGTAVKIEGADHSHFRDCSWSSNTTNLAILDLDSDNQTSNVEIFEGTIDAGAITFTGLLENVAFRQVRLTNIDVTITTPSNTILIEDCDESGVSISGDSTAWLRHETGDLGATFGITTGNTATKAWAITLAPGDLVYLEAKVHARRINGVAPAFYHISTSAKRVGSALAYDTQSANFTAGSTLTGATSGATAVIQADSDSGSTGTLTLIDIDGVFVDNEIITDAAGGSATVNGALVATDAALTGSVTALRTAFETNSNYDATFVANTSQIELRVTGDTSQTVEWTCEVAVTRN